MTDEEREAALAAAVNDATSPAQQRLDVVEAEVRNNASLQRLAAQGFGLTDVTVLGLRQQMLIEHLLGDLDMPRRLDYEMAFQSKLAEIIAEGESQITRAKLLNGVRLDQQRPGRPS